jgi:energy-coupling factor transporter ATP-binding protein EcfA2
LLILYGENGTGKTTILQLLCHLLSKEILKGHRTFLAKTPFTRFAVVLTNGLELSAERPRPVAGDFTMFFKSDDLRSHYDYKVNEKGNIPGLKDDQEHDEFMRSLPELNVTFLSDDRKISQAIEEEVDSDVEVVASQAIYRMMRAQAAEKGSGTSATVPALARLLEWTRAQALRASNEGERDVNAVYAEIIKRLSRFKQTSESSAQLLSTLEAQALRSRVYSQFGLTTELHIDELIGPITDATGERLDILAQVLRPYLESNDARLNALGPLQQTLEAFVKGINSFYANKKVTIHLREGVRILSANNQQLDPRSLSSGEKQLLILFCNVIQESEKPAIFIIDEPELSLNVDWQRKLIGSLVKLSRGNVQFVFATHSLELLARHRKNVARLTPPELAPAVVSSSPTEKEA